MHNATASIWMQTYGGTALYKSPIVIPFGAIPLRKIRLNPKGGVINAACMLMRPIILRTQN